MLLMKSPCLGITEEAEGKGALSGGSKPFRSVQSLIGAWVRSQSVWLAQPLVEKTSPALLGRSE